MNRLIIVVGPHGVGKTRLTDYLRDHIESCNLYRLSGQPEKGIDGLTKSVHMYEALFTYLGLMKDVSVTLLFDSFFMTEEAMCEIQDKVYSFRDAYQTFCERLNALPYDIYYFNLYLNDTSLYQERIASRMHHKYFSISSHHSITLQTIYQRISDELKEQEHIKVFDIPMDDFHVSYQKIDEILEVGREEV